MLTSPSGLVCPLALRWQRSGTPPNRTERRRQAPGKRARMGKKGRVFVRGMTSETYGLGEFRRQQLAAPRVRDDYVVVDDRRQRRALRRLGQVAHVVADRPRRRPVPHPDDPGPLRGAAAGELQPRPRPPERGGVLHPRGPRLRDPRRPALRLEAGRPGLRAHRLGAPALQPVRREGRRAGHEGQVHLDVHGPDPAGPQRTDRAAGRVRRARGLVADLDARCAGPQEGRHRRRPVWETHADGPDAGDELAGA